MSFSLQRILDFLDSQPEHVVMLNVARAFENGRRGLFSEKFIPYADLQILGYRGFRALLIAAYELDPDFVEFNKQDVYAIVRAIKGEEDNG